MNSLLMVGSIVQLKNGKKGTIVDIKKDSNNNVVYKIYHEDTTFSLVSKEDILRIMITY
ncbi:MAG: hypothetical protein N2043_01570 [Ignavibacterium sp.]|nr:hypothetical protein [Ignavibacterium sp.]